MFEFNNTSQKTVIRDFSKLLASILTVARITVRRHLATLYIRGEDSPEEYGELSYTEELPDIVPQSHGEYLDRLGYMFEIYRKFREDDESYRQRIIFAIKISATKYGVKSTLKFIFSNSFLLPKVKYNGAILPIEYDIEIRETINDYFDGCNTALNSPLRGKLTQQYGMIIYVTPLPTRMTQRGVQDIYTLIKSTSPNYARVVEGGSFRSFVGVIAAAGINIERVVFNQPGGSGNKGEYYDYKV